MRLLNLKLENFQGIRRADFNFDGKGAVIYGDNATGKTTVFNAMTWLLYDKSSTGAKNFTPKTRIAGGDVHNLNHSVTAAFAADDMGIVTFQKVFHEVYKKKKGAPTAEFSGHTTDYFINGVPAKEKEYQDTLTNLCGDSEKMKMLTMPNYFSEVMTADARRMLLLEMCGDIDDDEIITSNPELAGLKDALLIPGTPGKCYSVEEFKKIAKAKKSEINKDLDEIPSRIDEASRSIDPTASGTNEEYQVKIRGLESEIQELEKRIGDIRGGIYSENAGVVRELTRANEELANIRAAYQKKTGDMNVEQIQRIANIKLKIASAEAKTRELQDELDRVSAEHDKCKILRADLVNRYNKVNAEAFDESSAVCPTCGREYPAEQIEKMREAFNLNKSRRLEAINREGKEKASKDKIRSLFDRMESISTYLTATESEAEVLRKALTEAEKLLDVPPVEATDEYIAVTRKIADLETKKSETDNSIAKQTDAFKNDLNAKKSEREQAISKRMRLVYNDSARRRIEELREREKELAEQYEKTEQAMYLCDRFLQAKVSMLTQKINDKFKSVRFRLFQEQINGGLKEDCEVLIPAEDGRMIPFTFANNAARINAGLEIISVLSKYWGLEMPIFVDNAESVTRLTKTPTQTIRLVVSEPDKSLRMESDAA